MAIISIIIGGAVMYVSGASDGAVEKLAIDTRVLAKKTLTKAKLHERPHSIFITNEAIWAQPESIQDDEEEIEPPKTGLLTIPEEVTVSVQLNQEEGWFIIGKNDQPFVWTFTQSGLCYPIDLRFEGEAAVETMSFHPLTAGEIVDDQ